jgi:hypothetical protein
VFVLAEFLPDIWCGPVTAETLCGAVRRKRMEHPCSQGML